MKFRKVISVFAHSCATIGVVETLKGFALRALLPALRVLSPNITDRNYDERKSTDTASSICNAELEMLDSEAQKHATSYITAPERFIYYLISRLDINYQEYDFVDIGCGKGRVLLVASRFPFRSICGIELSQKAFKIAENNVRIYRSADQKCFDIQVRNEDARCFEPPLANTVYYFFEPFDIVTLDAVLTKIASKLRGLGKAIYVVCIWTDLASMLKVFESLGFRTIRSQKVIAAVFNYAIFFYNEIIAPWA